MNPGLSRLLEKLTPEEHAEVETFAAFLLARRSARESKAANNDVPTEELMQLVLDSGGFDWLDAPEEDVYSPEEGKAVRWPSQS